MQKSNTILKTAVLLLLLANLGLVAFMVWGKKSKNKNTPPDPYSMMAKELGLSADQEAEHRKMGEAHRETLKPLQDSLRELKLSFYMQYKDGTASDSALNIFGQQVSALQARVEKTNIAHFQKVRQWLKGPEQQAKYDTLVKKMMMRGKRNGGKK